MPKVTRLAFALAIALASLMGFSTTASAASLPILHASTNDEAHTCSVIGAAVDGYEGVVCTDILTWESGGDFYAEGETEVYCQTTAATPVVVQCANVTADVEMYNGDTGASGGTGDTYNECGHSYGDCSTGRNTYYTNYTWDYPTSEYGAICSASPDLSTQVWVLSKAGGATTIELPKSDTTEILNNDVEAGHDYICP